MVCGAINTFSLPIGHFAQKRTCSAVYIYDVLLPLLAHSSTDNATD